DGGGNPIWGNGYGNVTLEVTYGDYDLGGDEKTVRYTYYPNTSAYIVGKPASIDTFAGTDTGGSLLAETLYYYDRNEVTYGQSGWQHAPTRGKPTQTSDWLNSPSSYVASKASYDNYGNVLTQTDRLGYVIQYQYDTTYNTFVTKTTDPLLRDYNAQWNT